MEDFTISIEEGETYDDDFDSEEEKPQEVPPIEVHFKHPSGLQIEFEISAFDTLDVEDFENFISKKSKSLYFDDCNGLCGMKWKDNQIELAVYKHCDRLSITLPEKVSSDFLVALLAKRKEYPDRTPPCQDLFSTSISLKVIEGRQFLSLERNAGYVESFGLDSLSKSSIADWQKMVDKSDVEIALGGDLEYQFIFRNQGEYCTFGLLNMKRSTRTRVKKIQMVKFAQKVIGFLQS